MFWKIFILASAAILVSSDEGITTSSAFLHTNNPTVDVAFKTIGKYNGKTINDKNYSKTYYMSKHFKSNFPEAKAICKAFDLELATFETLQEMQNFFGTLLKPDHFSSFSIYAHIDGMTTQSASTTDWYWTNSGAKMFYSLSWAPGEPNNGVDKEGCLTVVKLTDKFALNDYPCASNPTQFICQETKQFALFLKHISSKKMFLKIFILTSAALLVSSDEGITTSSAFLHTNSPSFDTAFWIIGQYNGKTINDKNYSKTYYLSKHFKSHWAESKAICKSFDLELATFETLQEQQSFFDKLVKVDHISSTEAHIDGMATVSKSQTDWYWTNSGVKIPYQLLWKAGEPNNARGDEFCLAVNKFDDNSFGMNDYPCSDLPARFICQETKIA
ncbi:macrophage mannose receptor 1-like [Chironomus tepperi]|uniref:macrophage mannose receptor 1-like n=1 Tax=Chironomus tepperi TaxID=113505 RepID=UPI00391F7F50